MLVDVKLVAASLDVTKLGVPAVSAAQTLTGINLCFILWRQLRGRLFHSLVPSEGAIPNAVNTGNYPPLTIENARPGQHGTGVKKTMGRILFIFVLTVAFAGAAHAQGAAKGQTDAEAEEEVLKVEHQKDQAMQKGDLATLTSIYGDGLIFVNPRGQILSKAQRLADVKPGSLDYLNFKRDDYTLHVYGNTVVLTGVSRSVLHNHGKLIRTPRQFMQVYVKQGGQWRMVSHHANFVSENGLPVEEEK
jgi:ketosteroid isomerase-like protein